MKGQPVIVPAEGMGMPGTVTTTSQLMLSKLKCQGSKSNNFIVDVKYFKISKFFFSHQCLLSNMEKLLQD